MLTKRRSVIHERALEVEFEIVSTLATLMQGKVSNLGIMPCLVQKFNLAEHLGISVA